MKRFIVAAYLSTALANQAWGGNALIAYLDNLPERNDVINKLQGTGLISGAIDSFNIGTGTPTFIQLSLYDSIFVFNCCNPISNGAAFGNNLADYVDAGGGVVLADFGLGGGGEPAGRWLTGGYHPVVIGNSGFSPLFDTIGVRHNPGHPVLNNVATLMMGAWNSSHITRPIAPGAVNIVDWASGPSLVAEMPGFNGRILGLNLYPPSSDLDSRFWNVATDGDILMANAINYVARVPEPSLSSCTMICLVGLFSHFRRNRRFHIVFDARLWMHGLRSQVRT